VRQIHALLKIKIIHSRFLLIFIIQFFFMKANAGVIIGLALGVIGLAVGLAVAFTAIDIQQHPWIALVTVGPILLFGFLIYTMIIAPMIKHRRLTRIGIPAIARILQVRDTGITVNNQPQVKLIVEVKNSFGQRYEATLRTLVSRINPYVFQPGMEIPVLVDPKDEKQIIIDPNGENRRQQQQQSSAFSQNDLEAELAALKQEYESLMISGQRARALIKNNRWLGVYVNGQNPYTELEVEVLPDDKPAFGATIKAVIAEISVEKYQPGKEVFVKYDIYNPTRVTIDQPVMP
jgi:hypothetical protein